ncbi:MAG TPA: GvpL/GvpF family gas vesicle protein [Longimicrobiales bacterium]
MSRVIYLYGFVPVGTPAPPAEVRGIAETPLQLLDLGAVSAVVSQLPEGEYSAGVIESRLDDLAWVGAQGVAHERVVVWFADHAEILPARMFSIYSGEAALRSAVAGELRHLAEQLSSLSGMREWNLKVAYDADQLARHGPEVSAELRRIDREIAAAPPGRRYLLERQRAETVKDEVARAARALAGELLDALRTHAADVRVLPVTAGDDAGAVVLNAALLVPRTAEIALRDHAGELYERHTSLGMIVTFSGPWAPYRFVEQNGET